MKNILLLLGLLFCVQSLFCHLPESVATDTAGLVAFNTDSVQRAQYLKDSVEADYFAKNYSGSWLFSSDSKIHRYDVQQLSQHGSNKYVFFVLVVLLCAVTYVKTAFNKELSDLLQSLVNSNMAQQVFRTQTSEITLSSFLLHLNFILVMSLYVRFILVKIFGVNTLENFTSILFLIFLFTFFYIAKFFAIQVSGYVFEMKQVAEEYVFIFSTICKTLGLSLIPALFVFYTAPGKYLHIVYYLTLFVCLIFLILLLWRALSTSYKLMYRSIYHFIIYVCTQEMAMLFLFIKLLTKTVS